MVVLPAAVSLRPTRTVVTRTDGARFLERKDGSMEPLCPPGPAALPLAEPQVYLGEAPQQSRSQPGPAVGQRLAATAAAAHGHDGDPAWALPRLATACDRPNRPGFFGCAAHEYLDEDAVLDAKVLKLAELLRRSTRTVVYTGAGISTASGIQDYATLTKGLVPAPGTLAQHRALPTLAEPSFAHRAFAALFAEGLCAKWVQQNHDGLPQKAGVPQAMVNEIHGAWFDPSNPVVAMSADLRGDLFADLLAEEQSADLVLALGTSLAGMNADRLVSTAADKAARGQGLGSVIVNLQQTRLDDAAALRVFAPIDEVLRRLCALLHVAVPAAAAAPQGPAGEPDVFVVPYGPDGARGAERTLDLSEGKELRITGGRLAGAKAVVVGKNTQGAYRLSVEPLGGGEGLPMLLGAWWPAAALAASVPSIPVASP